jgi:hypothetical protein
VSILLLTTPGQTAMAHAIDSIAVLSTTLDDTDARHILHAAGQGLQQRLEAIRYNQWAHSVTRRSVRTTFLRRHKGYGHD